MASPSTSRPGGASPTSRPGGAPPDMAPALLGSGAFFVCDVWGAIPKADLAGMEHPMFSLATRPDRRILRYEHAGAAIEVVPSVKGLATIHDRDILIYCVSQLMAAINAGREVGRTLKLHAHDLLVATGRETSGDAYRRLREAFERLAGTRVTTDISTGPREARVRETTGFGLIEGWRIVRRRGPAGVERMDYVTVTLSDWLFRSVLSRAVLTLDRAYFGLRKPIERRIYELARKHCGRQPEWRVSVAVLHLKSGSASPRRVFRRMMRDMILAQPLPGYLLAEEEGDIVAVTPRRRTGTCPRGTRPQGTRPQGTRSPAGSRREDAPGGEEGPDGSAAAEAGSAAGAAAGQGASVAVSVSVAVSGPRGPAGTPPPGSAPPLGTGPLGRSPPGAGSLGTGSLGTGFLAGPPGPGSPEARPPAPLPLGSRPPGSRPLGMSPLGTSPLGKSPLGTGPLLPASALAAARGVMPGRDVHALEAEWLAFWEETGRPPLRDPSAAFLGWVRRRAGRTGRAGR